MTPTYNKINACIKKYTFFLISMLKFLLNSWYVYWGIYGKIGLKAASGEINAMKKTYLIGEVSCKVKLSQKRIREYEKEGFVAPIRDAKTNNRHYTNLDINQIKQINNLIHQHGFTISCLKTLLKSAPCWNIFDCKKTGECAAFKNPQTPCYVTIKNEPDSKCSTCPVYRNRNQKPINILLK